MKKTKRWLLVSAALLVCSAGLAQAAGPFKKVSIATTAKTTTTTTSTTPDPTTTEAEEVKPEGPTKNSKLTGIPQIDYIWDPNLPRELNGYNLSSYPFLSTVPVSADIHFKCDGLHDGFYSSIEYKCQVYHHCVYGIRHDFLCANFTAFDQRTFICHFASDVDCEGSQKYWNRNDALYMATTTSTSSTTTTEAPPPTPRRRPFKRLRPLRRPVHRPDDDYYYEGEEEYADEYYEERPHGRRKPRPRQRKPVPEYDDEYYDKRGYVEGERRKRPNSRDRFHDEEEPEEDYDVDRRKYDRPKSRNPNRAVPTNERRKAAGRKPIARPSDDGRRSFSDDRPSQSGGRKEKPRPVAALDEVEEPMAVPPRRAAGRRRIGDKRTSLSPSADLDDLDDYEKPKPRAPDQEEAAADEDAGSPSKVKTTPKPLEEFVTPKAASASVYARPRAPPRIARPVPVNEKKKYQYPVQKTGTTVAPTGLAAEDDYYEETDDYEEPRAGGHRAGAHGRRREGDPKVEEDILPQTSSRRRQHGEAAAGLGRKPTRTTLRKPVTDKKPVPLADEEEYDSRGPVGGSGERYDSRGVSRRRPYTGRTRGRGNEDVDFVDDEYEERPPRPAHRLRPKAGVRLSTKKPLLPVTDEVEEDDDQYEVPEVDPPPPRSRTGSLTGQGGRRKIASPARLRQAAPAVPALADSADAVLETELEDVEAPKASRLEQEVDADAELPSKAHSPNSAATSGGRPTAVRVVKRPFLPSRGGSPYLPRGLQPVGGAHMKSLGSASHTTDRSPLDMGSTISGVRLLEHGAPLLRATDSSGSELYEPPHGPRTTLPPRSTLSVASVRPPAEPSLSAKVTLDELYENDYDVTLNDALNPTLKPLSSPLSQQAFHHSHHQNTNRNYHHSLDSDSVSSTDIDSASSASSTSVSSANAFVNNNQSPALNRHQQQAPQQPAQQEQVLQQQQHNLQIHAKQQQPEQQHLQHQLHANAYQSMPYQSSPHYQTPSTLSLSHSQSPQSLNHQMHASLPQQPHQHQSQHPQHQPYHQPPVVLRPSGAATNYNSDSYFSPTDNRRRAAVAAPPPRSSDRSDYRGAGARLAQQQHFYDGFEY